MSEGKIGELIRGNKDALQAQASIGGNAPRAEANQLPPGMLSFDPKTGDFLPNFNATKAEIANAQALQDQIQKATATAPTPATSTQALQKAQPNNTEAMEAVEARAEIEANQAAEKAFSDYLEAKQDRTQFESEEAAAKARQESFERFVRGQQSAAGAANASKNPANAKKAKSDPKSTEPEGEAKKEAQAEKPWWQSSGGGPRFLFGGQGAGGDVQRSVGGLATAEAAAQAGQAELLKRKQARASSKGGATPPPTAPPSK